MPETRVSGRRALYVHNVADLRPSLIATDIAIVGLRGSVRTSPYRWTFLSCDAYFPAFSAISAIELGQTS